MPTSDVTRQGRGVVLVTLLFANALLYVAVFWLPSDERLGVPAGGYVLSETRGHAWLFEAIRRERRILFLGTSESNISYNLGAQLNHLTPHDPQVVVVARAGTSPIHTSLLFTRGKIHRVTTPPLVLVVNLVYFTRSHDVIDDGWLGNVLPSPAFYLMNHEGIRTHLSEPVREAYDQHFALRRLLYPFSAQEYLGSLLYLRVRYPVTPSTFSSYLQASTWRFTGRLPRYDENRNVWAGYKASDEAARARWEVSSVDESPNLKGLGAILMILREEAVPILLLIMPTNRAFYRYYDLDMAEYDQRYRAIRDEIRSLAAGESIFVLDLYEGPHLDLGFRDRMHLDEYGNSQLAHYIIGSPQYEAFIDAVREHYERIRSNRRG